MGVIQMGKYVIHYERKACIGAGVCAAVAPDFWVMNQDGKADLADSKPAGEGMFEREIDEKDLEANKQAAEGCPAIVIHIRKKDTGEKVA
jgi:ferredoxin